MINKLFRYLKIYNPSTLLFYLYLEVKSLLNRSNQRFCDREQKLINQSLINESSKKEVEEFIILYSNKYEHIPEKYLQSMENDQNRRVRD